MRCKSCDVILSEKERVRKNEHDEYEDLCGACEHIVNLDVDDLFIYNDYAHSALTEAWYSEFGINFESEKGDNSE